MTTSYSNIGGTGARPWLAVTMSGLSGGCSPPKGPPLVDGSMTDGCTHATAWGGSNTAGEIKFDFGEARVVDEFKWYQGGPANNGTWKWAGSNDDSTYTDLHTGFTLGGSATVTYSYSNTTAYRYYKLIQTGGTTSASDYIREIEFQIDEPPTPTSTTWSPYDKSGDITLSSGNLEVSSPALTDNSGARANVSETAGKFYYEVAVTSNDQNFYNGFGVAKLSQALDSVYAGTGGMTVSANGAMVVNGSIIVSGYGTVPGHTLCIAIDLDNQRAWSRIDGGNWNNDGSANPATNTNGVDISGSGSINSQACAPVMASVSTTCDGTANFGDSSYAQTPPSGFGNWAQPLTAQVWASTEAADTFFSGGETPSVDTANVGTVMVSDDGADIGNGAVGSDLATWSLTDLPTFINGGRASWVDIAYSRKLNRYVAISSAGDNNNNAIALSTDEGHTWVGQVCPSAGSWGLHGIVWADALDLFVIVSTAGPTTTARILTSPNGEAPWTEQFLPDMGIALRDIAWSPELGLLCAVGDSNALYTSPDSVVWTAATSLPGTSRDWISVCWAGDGRGNGMQEFATVTSNAAGSNQFAHSADGASWTQGTVSGSFYTWRGIAYSDDRDQLLIYGGNTGVVNYTSGGVISSFTEKDTGIGTVAFHAAAWSNTFKQWVVAGNPSVWTSPTAAVWAQQADAPTFGWDAMTVVHYDRWVSTEAPDSFAAEGFPIPYNVVYIIDADQDFIVPRYTAIQFELYGGGASGNGLNTNINDFADGVAGNDTQIAALSLIAHGGAAIVGTSNPTVPVGSAGGTASGGDTNTTGGSGDNGVIDTGTGHSGKGGDAPGPDGGAGGAAVNETDGAPFQHGNDGIAPGGGGSGVPLQDSTGGFHRDGAGGGSGAYLTKTYLAGITSGRPAVGDVLSLSIAQTTINPNSSPPIYPPGTLFATSTFGKGAHGRIKISVEYNPIQGPLAVTEPDDTFLAFVSGWHSVETPDAFAAIGVVPSVGLWGSTEPVDTFHAIGYIPALGTLDATEADDVFHGTGFPGLGAWASTEADDFFFAIGPGATPRKRRIFFAT